MAATASGLAFFLLAGKPTAAGAVGRSSSFLALLLESRHAGRGCTYDWFIWRFFPFPLVSGPTSVSGWWNDLNILLFECGAGLSRATTFLLDLDSCGLEWSFLGWLVDLA